MFDIIHCAYWKSLGVLQIAIMRQKNMMIGLDMEQTSQGFVLHPDPCIVTNFRHPDIPPVNIVPNLEAHSLQEPNGNNLTFYGHRDYHHQPASNLGAGMSTPPNFYLPPYAAFHAPPSHMLAPGIQNAVVGVNSAEHERNAHFMGHGYKRKSADVIPGNSQYPNTAAETPCSFPQMNTLETAPFSFPQLGTSTQQLDQRSVRNRAGAATMDPHLSHGHNNFIQANNVAPPFPPPGPIWYGQHSNGNSSDGSSSLWSQPPYVPYMHGNVVTGSIDSGNACFPRYHHETSSSRTPPPFVYPRHNYIYHHPVPPPAIVYPHMASASYYVPETMHDASYSHVGPIQSTGFRINQQHPREDFVHAAILRHRELPHLRETPADVGDFYDAVNYVDHHQDMRLDIEDMSYEELLALSDQIGTVKTGLSEEDVKDLLNRRTSLTTRINLEKAPSIEIESDSCTICQEIYNHQDKIATLDCRHEYHVECLKKWLVIKNVCPICKSEALAMEKKKKKLRLSIGEEVAADST